MSGYCQKLGWQTILNPRFTEKKSLARKLFPLANDVCNSKGRAKSKTKKGTKPKNND